MTERIRNRTVSFQHPFRLSAVDSDLPAGTYSVETVEEQIDSLTVVAFRRVSTTMTVPNGVGSRQVITVSPEELETALERDARLGA